MTSRRATIGLVLGCWLLLGVIVIGQGCSRGTSATTPGGLSQLEQDTGVQWVAVPDSRFGTTGGRIMENLIASLRHLGTRWTLWSGCARIEL
jgi:hypothetical protein